MDVYDELVYDVQRYLQWPEINFRDEHPISFAFFQELEDKYEITKAKIHVKEVISKDDIQDSWSSRRRGFLITQLLYTNLWSTWRNSKNVILSLDRKSTRLNSSH